MKKKVLMRGLIGIPIGISLSYLITVIISAGWGGGHYFPCVPELIEITGNEINAVIVQLLFSVLLGAGLGMISMIWEMETWSIVRQTGIYFLAASVIMLPVAYFTHWMEHSVRGFVAYYGIFISIFILVWLMQFFIGKNNVKKLNDGLHKAKIS